MQGYLKMSSGFLSFKSRYYFILNDNKFIYLEDKGKEKMGQIPIQYAKIQSFDNSSFTITIDQKQYTLEADQPAQKKLWTDALKHSINNDLIQNKKSKNKGSGNKKLDNTVAEIWSLQAQMQQNIQTLKSKKNLQQIELRYLNRISKISEHIKKKVSLVKQIVDRQQLNESIKHHSQKKNKKKDAPISQDQFQQFQENYDQTQFMSFIDNDQYSNSSHHTQNFRMFSDSKTQINIEGLTRSLDPLKSKLLMLNDVYKVTPYISRQSFRKDLPKKRSINTNVNLIKVFKDSVSNGNQYQVPSIFPLLVYLNQPLSILQKLAEPLLYRSCLEKANMEKQSTKRLAYVVCYQIAKFSLILQRSLKPFNCLLGQTYQFINDDVFFLSQLVNKKPLISASITQSKHYKIIQNSCIDNSIGFGSLKLIPQHKIKLFLKKNSDQILIEAPTLALRGLILGKTYFQVCGSIKIENLKTGDKAVINFSQGGMLGKLDCRVNGYIMKQDGYQKYRIQGGYDNQIAIVDIDKKVREVLWQIPKDIPGSQSDYFMCSWLKQLNFLNLDLLKKVAPTDSRLRPDMRALQNGYLQMAEHERSSMFEQQRQFQLIRRRGQSKVFQGRWFKKVGGDYQYKGGYMQSRRKERFSGVLQIF